MARNRFASTITISIGATAALLNGVKNRVAGYALRVAIPVEAKKADACLATVSAADEKAVFVTSHSGLDRT